MTPAQVLDLVGSLQRAFPQQDLTEGNIQAYCENLIDLDYALAAEVVNGITKARKFWPAIADIRRAYAERKLNAPNQSAAFKQALTDPSHPLVIEARQLVGDGWDWRQGNTTDLSFRFREAYKEVLEEAIDRIVIGEPMSPTIQGLPTSDKIARRHVGEPEQIEGTTRDEGQS